jgi:hypothetical protein
MKQYIEGACLACGETIWYRWQGHEKLLYDRYQPNPALDDYEMWEIEPLCPECGAELDNDSVIDKSLLEG